MELRWNIEQARRYQLWATRLVGTGYPPGEEGIQRCFADLGSVQLDPLPILGRNHDLVFQSRVVGTHPDDALDLIHRQRLGFEYWDKMLCAIALDAYPLFSRLMNAGGMAWERDRAETLERAFPGIIAQVLAAVRQHGPLSSRELRTLDIAQQEHRGWKATRTANVALEALWNRGELCVSHRTSYRRYFDVAARVLPEAVWSASSSPAPFAERLLRRRVAAVGLLSAAGDSESWAFLRAARREGLPQALVRRGELVEVHVQGIRAPFYALPSAEEDLVTAMSVAAPDVPQFLAPLDSLLWGRDSLQRVWDFEYVWEVYKPVCKRRWGYYVLPILFHDRFVGRFDGRYDRATGVLHVVSYGQEPHGLRFDAPEIQEGFSRFLAYLGGERIALPTKKNPA